MHNLWNRRDREFLTKLECVQRVSFLEGHPGCLAVQTAVAYLLGNKAQAHNSMQVGGCPHACLQQLTADKPE